MKRLSEVLEHVQTVGIAGHVKPDGDCVGSCLAVYNYIRSFYPQIDVSVFLEPIPHMFEFLECSEEIIHDYPEREPVDLFITLDCGDESRLGKAVTYFKNAKKTVCIDHHVSNLSFAETNYIFPDASSTCELIYELLEPERVTEKIAECIYTGMVTDTGVFQYSCTSSKTMNIAGALMDKGIPFTRIVDNTFYEKTYEQNRILGRALIKSKLHFDGKVISSVLSLDEMHEYQVLPKHLEGIVSHMRSTKGVDTAVFFYENEDLTWKASLRSANVVDCAKITQKYGGGGHVRAAGVTMGEDVSNNMAIILEEIKRQLDENQ